jgi:hypothetical protein
MMSSGKIEHREVIEAHGYGMHLSRDLRIALTQSRQN